MKSPSGWVGGIVPLPPGWEGGLRLGGREPKLAAGVGGSQLELPNKYPASTEAAQQIEL